MIKRFKFYILSVAVALSATSCLDKMPEDEVPFDQAIQTVSDANLAVIGIYDAFKSNYLYSGNLTLLPDIQTDLVYGVKGNTNVYGDIWRWKDIKPTNTDIEGVYGSLYEVINRCNFLLDRTDALRKKVTNDDDLDKLDQYCGEAYFARALAYSELIKLFCTAYDPATAENELGVILTEHYRGDEEMKRSSLKASYEFVLADLERAEQLLKLEEDYDVATNGNLYDTTYFNEYTVHALRSRVYLYMQQWKKAEESATKVIDSGYYILSSCNTQYGSTGQSYYEYMWTNDHSSEAIWKIGFTINSYGGALGTVFANYDFTSFRPDYVPAEWVINLYDNNDKRVSTFFQNMTTGYSHQLSWPLLIKYFGNEEFFNYNIVGVTMPKVFRLSEQYLIRAEAYVKQGEYGKAASDITTLRSARYTTYGSTALSKENAMKVIMEERVKELYMEGFRLNDLKRWSADPEGPFKDQEYVFQREPQDQSLENGSSLKVKKGDKLFVWPIPQHELDAPGSEVEPNESNK